MDLSHLGCAFFSNHKGDSNWWFSVNVVDELRSLCEWNARLLCLLMDVFTKDIDGIVLKINLHFCLFHGALWKQVRNVFIDDLWLNMYILFTDYCGKYYVLYCYEFSPIAKIVNIVAWCKFCFLVRALIDFSYIRWAILFHKLFCWHSNQVGQNSKSLLLHVWVLKDFIDYSM